MKRALCFLLFGLACGCRGEVTQETPWVGIRGMYDQPKYEMQSEGAFFEDGRSMRPPVEGTLSREEEIDPEVSRGRLEDETGYVLAIPQKVVDRFDREDPKQAMSKMEERGKERYNIYCQPCHGLSGDGKGMVVRHGMLPPPTYHQDRLRHAPDGQIYATIENGKGNMPAYGPQIPINDRWAIVAYVRALQLSQEKVAQEAPK